MGINRSTSAEQVNESTTAKQMKSMTDKAKRELAGKIFYIPIEEWKPQHIYNWLTFSHRGEGFDQFAELIMTQKINGAMLKGMERTAIEELTKDIHIDIERFIVLRRGAIMVAEINQFLPNFDEEQFQREVDRKFGKSVIYDNKGRRIND